MSVRKIVPIEKAVWDVAPPGHWVVENEPDWDFKVPAGEEYGLAILLQDEQRLVETHASYSRTVRQLLTLGAVQALSQTSIDFDPAAFKLWIHELAVWRKDLQGTWKKRSHAQRENLLLRQREEQLEQQMLHGRVSVVALLEDVRVGDAIEIAYTLEPTDPLPGWRFTAFFGWGWSIPNARVLFSLQLDPAQKVNWRWHVPPDGGPQPTEEATPDRVTWRMERAAPIEPEPNAPGSSWPIALLDISGWESWGDVARFVVNLWDSAYSDGAEAVAAEAARLRVENDPAATARAVIRFVQEEVRYLAIDFGHGGGVLPNGAGTVLRRRFGDCKDKAVLLTAMLRAVGLEAWPVLVAPNWREALDRVQPSTGAFSHAIVVVTVGDLRRFVDPTFVGQSGDFFVEPDYRRGLILREDTEALVTLPPPKCSEFKLTEVFDLRTKEPGHVEISVQATGRIADSVRAAVLRQGLAAFAKAEATRLQKHFPALEPQLDTAVVDDDASADKIRVAATHALPTWGAPGQPRPTHFRYGAHGLFLIVEAVGGPQVRKQPWVLPFPVQVHHRVVVRGAGVQRVQAERFRHVGPGFRYGCDVTNVRGEVTFDYEWETTQPEIAPADWPKYLRERETAFGRAGAFVPVLSGSAVKRWFGGRGAPQRGIGALVSLIIFAVVAVIGAFSDHNPPRRYTAATPRMNLNLPEMSRPAAASPSLELARGALGRGEFGVADAMLASLQQRYGSDARYDLARAEAFIGTRQLEQARAAIRHARTLAPDTADADAVEALLQEWLGDLPTARELAERAYSHKPNGIASQVRLGEISARLGDDSRAEGLLGGVVRQRPQQLEAALAYALYLWKHGDQKGAEATMAAATARAVPRTAATEIALAQFFTATGRSGDAVAPARRAVEYAPNESTAAYRLVTALLRAGRKTEAAMETREMLRRFPQAALTWAGAAEVSLAGGPKNLDDAERCFQRWLQIAPADPLAQSEHALHLLHLQRGNDARRELEAATARSPKSGWLWGRYGAVLNGLGETSAAADAKAKADRLLPDRDTATLLY